MKLINNSHQKRRHAVKPSRESSECFREMQRSDKWMRFTLAHNLCVNAFEKSKVKRATWLQDEELRRLADAVLLATKIREKSSAIRKFIDYSKLHYIESTPQLEKLGF